MDMIRARKPKPRMLWHEGIEPTAEEPQYNFSQCMGKGTASVV
jgi:hypothetical protein